MKDYKAEFGDENFEIIHADNDDEALREAFELEEEHGTLFNLFEIDEDYNEVRTVF